MTQGMSLRRCKRCTRRTDNDRLWQIPFSLLTENKKILAGKLESLWQGSFGDEYTERNAAAADRREPFWRELLTAHPCTRVLEVGCNLGANLKWVSRFVPPHEVYGIDINEHALKRVRTELPDVNAVWGKARELPFRDSFFDLVFTCGVLIHQPPDVLPDIMAEIVRCSSKYILAAEYYAESLQEIPYRGQQGALFKADYGAMYQKYFSDLRLLKKGLLSKKDGWDDVTYWLFEKS